MKRKQKTRQWTIAKRLRKKAKRSGKKVAKPHSSVHINHSH